MPRRSRKDTLKTVRTITRAAEHQLITIGYDAMSYTTLSEQTGVSRTGISHHFPHKSDFVTVNHIKIYNRFIAFLNLEKDLNTFSESWSDSLTKTKFRGILKLVFRNALTCDGTHQMSVSFTDSLTTRVVDSFGKEGEEELERLLGRSFLAMK